MHVTVGVGVNVIVSVSVLQWQLTLLNVVKKELVWHGGAQAYVVSTSTVINCVHCRQNYLYADLHEMCNSEECRFEQK